MGSRDGYTYNNQAMILLPFSSPPQIKHLQVALTEYLESAFSVTQMGAMTSSYVAPSSSAGRTGRGVT